MVETAIAGGHVIQTDSEREREGVVETAIAGSHVIQTDSERERERAWWRQQ